MIGGQPKLAMIKLGLGSILPAGIIIDKKDQGKMYPLSGFMSKLIEETGYLHIQASKPDTIG